MKTDVFKMDPLALFSHELKTPLSTFQLALSLLEQDFEKNKKLIPLIKDELVFLNRLIQDNLDMRLLTNQKDLIQYKWHNFNHLIKQVCLSHQILANQKNLSFKINSTQELEAFIDDSWFICVLKNLLSNAINFSVKKSSIFIDFKWDKDKNFNCSVANKSETEIDCEKVFNLFYTTRFSQKIRGTGIGLSLVKSIVEAHGGTVKAYFKNQKFVISFNLPKARLANIAHAS